MRKTRNTKLNLLSLEDRLSPSVTTMTTPVTGGGVNLSVNGNSAGGDTILVHARAGNQVSVYALPGDQYAAYQANPGPFLIANETGPNQIGAAFFVTGYMAVTTGNAADTVIISIDTGLAMGDVSITTNGGNDNQILQAYNNDHPSVNRVSFSAGAGADNMFIFDMNINSNMVADGGASGFRSPGVFTPGPVPGDVFELFDCVTKTVNVTSAIVGIDDHYGGSTINGDLTVNDPVVFTPAGPGSGRGGFYVNQVPYPAGFTTYPDPSGYNGLLVINANSVVNGNVTYYGSADTDGTYIQGTVTGNVSVNGGLNTSTEANDYVLSGHVGGFYTVAGTDGIDHVGLLGGAYVGGPVQFGLREGKNTYDLDHAYQVDAAATVSVVGFTITAGASDDNVGRISGTIGAAGVAVNQLFTLGAGNNTLIWDGTFIGNTNSRLDFTTLGGMDRFDFYNNGAGTNPLRLFANMGDGNDIINVFVGTKVAYSQLDFGAGTDTFSLHGNPNNTPAALANYWHATNFEVVIP